MDQLTEDNELSHINAPHSDYDSRKGVIDTARLKILSTKLEGPEVSQVM